MGFKELLTVLIYLVPSVMLLAMQKIVYQKDVSEYCRRRVMPSIFLARNSIESTSVILHFSRAELPYSCAISVRTESGSNIIMVSKFNPQSGLADSCADKSPELVVHEMGETFGGYWGQLPERVIRPQELPPKQYYTLKTTQSISTRETVLNITVPQVKSTKKLTKPPQEDDSSEEDDTIKIEVPLVNVYGKFVPDEGNRVQLDDPDTALADLLDSVTPESGVVYDTKIIPIVQFSVKKLVTDKSRRGEDPDEPRFDLDIVEQYTPDKRLTTRHYASTTRLRFKKLRQKMTSNRRRMYFRKNFSSKGKLQSPQFTTHTKDYVFPTTKASNLAKSSNLSNHRWKTIEELMTQLNKTSVLAKEVSIKDMILQKIADKKHNSSIYLKPNFTAYFGVHTTSRARTKITKYLTVKNTNPKKNLLNQDTLTPTYTKHNTVKALNSVLTMTRQPYSSKINENFSPTTVKSIDISNHNKSNKILTQTLPPKSLVDHESWENVVQAAPDIAVLLNITDNVKLNDTTVSMDMNKNSYSGNQSDERKRRHLHAIDIENARPYNLSTRYMTAMTTEKDFLLADIQEFPQLVEMQDDDLYGRIALRYMRHYVGPAIFNICEYTNTTKRQHVNLFNASRIVITINNFTHLTGLSLVLTTARTLLSGIARCPATNIECQVEGARVCIDSMAACDGVPNCGSYDVYDEDRLMCGASNNLRYNVYIAAFTFLAVLMTLLYAIHYWLKRCVPKVADAFFVFTNGNENVLYLQPLMRSPHDTGEDTKLFYHPNLFENDYEVYHAPKKSLYRRCFHILCCGLCTTEAKRPKTIKTDLTLGLNKVFSFTQNEIQKMFDTTKTDDIQTRDSVANQKKTEKKKRKPVVDSEEGSNIRIHDSVLTLEDPFPEDYKDELEILKFFKDRRTLSSDSRSPLESKKNNDEETNNSFVRSEASEEIYNYSFNSIRASEPGPANVKSLKRDSKTSSRRLRFDEMTTQIPASIMEVDEGEIEEIHKEPKHNFLDAVLGRQRKMEDDNEPHKDHKRFMIGNKKTKKNQNRNVQPR